LDIAEKIKKVPRETALCCDSKRVPVVIEKLDISLVSARDTDGGV
jgi:hypothetical protein